MAVGYLSPIPFNNGLTLITSGSITAQNTISISNCFNSKYDNYIISVNLVQDTTAQNEMRFRLRTSSGDDSSSIYSYTYGISYNGGVGWQIFGGSNSNTYGVITTAYYAIGMKFNIYLNGINTANKNLMATTYGGNAASNGFGFTGNDIGSGSHTGISIYSSAGGNYTGTVTVYGLSK